jgi:hypothetical protein
MVKFPSHEIPGRGLQLACKLRDGWIAVATFVRVAGSMSLADLTITAGEIPEDERSDRAVADTLGGWFAERRYLDPSRQDAALAKTHVPHSIRARLLREVPIDEMSREAADQIHDYVDFGEYLRQHGAPNATWRHLVELELGDDNLSPARLDYLRAAVAWTARPLHFKESRAAVRAELGITEQQLTDRLRWARKLEYLTSPGRGRIGGDLTDLGAALAARHLSRENR